MGTKNNMSEATEIKIYSDLVLLMDLRNQMQAKLLGNKVDLAYFESQSKGIQLPGQNNAQNLLEIASRKSAIKTTEAIIPIIDKMIEEERAKGVKD